MISLKKISALVLTGAVALSTHAQWRYGVRAGGDISTARLSHAPNGKLQRGSGFSGGLTLEYHFLEPLAADVSILYTRMPNKMADGLDSDMIQRVGSDYLQIPLTVKYKHWLPSTRNLAAPYLFTGPDMMVRLDGDKTHDMRRFMPGWQIGIGFDVINFIQIQAGYRFALTDAFPSHDYVGAHVKAPSMRTDAVTISAAILFDF